MLNLFNPGATETPGAYADSIQQSRIEITRIEYLILTLKTVMFKHQAINRRCNALKGLWVWSINDAI